MRPSIMRKGDTMEYIARKKWSHVITGALLCCIVVFAACKNNIGLGSTIDINPPEIKSVYPPIGAVIRGDFVLAVKAEDDTKIQQVSAIIKSKDTDRKYAENFILSEDGAYWTRRLNAKDESGAFKTEKFLRDGSYSVAITVHDASGKETTVESAFTVDNTPPLLILSRPGTAVKGNADPAADVFGDRFYLAGQVYDKSDVAALTISAKDPDGNEKGRAVLTNIPQSLRMTVDMFFKQNSNQADGFYRAVYGNDPAKGKQQYSYAITVSDSARTYTDPKNTAGSGTGNATDTYYLYDELYQLLRTYKPAELYAMQSGVYVPDPTRAADTVSGNWTPQTALALLQDPAKKLGGNGIRNGTFALNPSINPKYSVEGFSPRKLNSEPDSVIDADKLYNGSIINVKLSTNFDEDPLNPVAQYQFYIIDLDKYAAARHMTVYELLKTPFDVNNDDDLYSDKAAAKLHDGIMDITPAPEQINKSGSSYIASIKLDNLSYHSSYVLQVRGCDQNSATHTLIADPKDVGGGRYIFKMIKSGARPEVSVTKVNGKDLQAGRFYIGTGQEAEFDVGLRNASGGTVVCTLMPSFDPGDPVDSASGKNVYTVTKPYTAAQVTGEPAIHFDIPQNKFSQHKSSGYRLTVQAKDTQGSGDSLVQEYQLYYDVEGPVISTNIERTVMMMPTISGDIYDVGIGFDETDGAFISVYRYNDEAPQSVDFSKKPTANDNTWILNTISGGEGKYDITLTAKDKLGNESVPLVRSFMYDAAAPQIEAINGKSISDLKKNPAIIGGAVDGGTNQHYIDISGSITETNGIQSVTVDGYPADITGSAPAYTFTYRLEKDTDWRSPYPLSIVVTDKADKTDRIDMNVTIDTEAPAFTEMKVGNATVTKTDTHPDIFTNNTVANATYFAATIPVKGIIQDFGSGVKEVTATWLDGSTDKSVIFPAVAASSAGMYTIEGALGFGTLTDVEVTFTAKDGSDKTSAAWKTRVSVVSSNILLLIEKDITSSTPALEKEGAHYVHTAFKIKVKGKWEGSSAQSGLELSVTKDGAAAHLSSAATPPAGHLRTEVSCDDAAILPAFPATVSGDKITGLISGKKVGPVSSQHEYTVTFTPRITGADAHKDDGRYVFTFKDTASNAQVSETIYIDTKGPSIESSRPAAGAAISLDDAIPGGKLSATMFDAAGVNTATARAYYRKKVGSAPLASAYQDLTAAEAYIALSGSPLSGAFKNAKVWNGSAYGGDPDTAGTAAHTTSAATGTSASLLTEGEYEVWFGAQDNLNQLSTTEPITVIYDTADPTATLKISTDNGIQYSAVGELYVKAGFKVKVNGSDTNGVKDIKLQLKKDDPTVTVWSDMQATAATAASFSERDYEVAFTVAPNNVQGAYTLRAIVTDKAERQAVETCAVVYDTTEPSLTVPALSAIRNASATPPIGMIIGSAPNEVYWMNKSTILVSGGASADYPASGANKASGIKQIEYSVNGGSSWSVITTGSGAWTATVNPGTQGVIFRAADKAGNTKTESRQIKSDMIPPTLTVKNLKRQGASGSGTADLSAVQYLNAAAKLDITYTVEDEANGSGIRANSVKVAVKSGSVIQYEDLGKPAAAGDNIATIDAAHLTALIDGDYTVELSVMDNAGNSSVARIFNIKIDRKPPTITMLSPAPNEKHQLSDTTANWAKSTRLFGKVRVTGAFSDDGSGMNDPLTCTYIIGKDKTSPKPLLNGDTFKPVSNGSWALDLANAENYCKTDDYVLPNGRFDENDAPSASGIIYKIPLYMTMEDKAGNKAEQAFYIMVDSSGKTPVIDIQAPSQETPKPGSANPVYNGLEVITVGGTVQFSGLVQTANPAAGTIDKVYVRFSTNENFSDNFTARFKAHGDSTAVPHNLAALTGNNGITIADGTNLKKWSFTVDTNDFVAGTVGSGGTLAGSDGSVTLFYSIQAQNNEGTSVWTNPRKIVFDKNYPYVTARKVKQLVTAPPPTYHETEYINNSPVKDGDILECDLLSVNDISEITLKSGTVGADYINAIGTKTGDAAITGAQIDTHVLFERISGATNAPRGYRMKLPIKLNGLKDPEQILSIEVSITDNKTDGKKTNFVQFNLKYDKTDPAVIFGTPVGKIGTGNFSAASANDITAATADMQLDDLYVFVETKDGSAKEIKVTGAGNGYISYANAGEIFSNTGSLYVLVRKNTIVYDSAASDWQLQGFAYDTGTGVDEVTAKLGTLPDTKINTFTPELGYFSSFKQPITTKTLPDGKSTLALSVKDKAGRTGAAPHTPVYVRNKPLTISKVHFKTDLNGDGAYSDDGNTGRVEIQSAAGHAKRYIDSGETNRADQQNYIQKDMDIHEEFSFKNKEKSQIVFELDGGQGTAYSYEIYKADTEGRPVGAAVKNGTLTDKIIDFAAADFAAGKIIDGDNQKFVIVLKETNVDDPTRQLRLTVTLNVKTKDSSRPQVTVLPFYWNGDGIDAATEKPKNSLLNGDRSNGHIEITRVSSGSGVSDVSGTVIVRGTAYHPSRLAAIELTVPGVGTHPKVAYTNGAWAATAGSGLSVADERLDVNGHWVIWEYEWKTGAPALDQVITVKAIRTDDGTAIESAADAGAELTPHTAEKRGDSQSMTLAVGDTVVKGQFIRLFKDDQSYVVTVNEVKKDGNKMIVGWKIINVPKDISGYYIYPIAYGTETQSAPTYNRASVKLNVVPYITALESTLSDSDETLTRSALGVYPVAQGSTIKLHGFNITSQPEVKLGTQPLTVGAAANGDGSYDVTIPADAVSGALTVKVSGIEAINNSNKAPEFAADGTATAAAYNVQSTLANKRLTDDLKLSVWEVSDFKAGMSKSLTSPMLKIAADSKWYMSYGKGATDMIVNANGAETKVDQSYSVFHNTAVAYDKSGNIYATATNTDRIEDWSAKFSFYSRIPSHISSAFPTPDPLTALDHVITIDKFEHNLPKYKYGFGARSYQLNWKGKSRLEKVFNQGQYNTNRVPRPKMAAIGDTAKAEVYMSYFDANHPMSPVKFRYGAVDNNNIFTGGIKDGGTTRVHTVNSVSVTDAEYHANALQGENGSASGYHTVADNTTAHKGGAYTAVGIVPKGKAGTAKDVAVVAWYDAVAKHLVYSYNTAPDTPVQGGVWQTNARVIDTDQTSGWYVDLTVDEDGGIHIAYYNNRKSELRYIYLSAYNDANPKKVTIDSYQSVGTQVTVTTRKEGSSGNEKIVPYISYYQSAFYNSPNSVRVAWRTDFTDVKDGAKNDLFTGAWEAMTIPVQDGTVPQDATICNGVPTSGAWANTVVLGFMTNNGYKKAVLKK